MTLPILLLIVLMAFLGLLGVLALAVTKTVNPDGSHARGVFGGLASAFALVFLCGLGTVGTGAFLAATLVGTAVEHNPVERIEIRRAVPTADDTIEPRVGDDRHGPVHLLFTVRGDAGRELVRMMREFVVLEGDMEEELDELLTIHERQGPDGTEYRIFEFHLPVSQRDLDELEREIRRELDGLRVRLPDSVAVEFEGAQRFY